MATPQPGCEHVKVQGYVRGQGSTGFALPMPFLAYRFSAFGPEAILSFTLSCTVASEGSALRRQIPVIPQNQPMRCTSPEA